MSGWMDGGMAAVCLDGWKWNNNNREPRNYTWTQHWYTKDDEQVKLLTTSAAASNVCVCCAEEIEGIYEDGEERPRNGIITNFIVASAQQRTRNPM